MADDKKKKGAEALTSAHGEVGETNRALPASPAPDVELRRTGEVRVNAVTNAPKP